MRGHSFQYLEQQVLTAGREQLLLLTYDGVLRFLARARRGLRDEDYHEKHLGITRAQALLIELRRSLDFTSAPALAHNLARIYTYLVEELARADAEDDAGRLEQAAALVAELRSAWDDAIRQTTAAAAGEQEGGQEQ